MSFFAWFFGCQDILGVSRFACFECLKPEEGKGVRGWGGGVGLYIGGVGGKGGLLLFFGGAKLWVGLFVEGALFRIILKGNHKGSHRFEDSPIFETHPRDPYF